MCLISLALEINIIFTDVKERYIIFNSSMYHYMSLFVCPLYMKQAVMEL